MKNKRASEDFEHLIERIHKLVETEDSKVTWNDRIIDPDNLEQLRQIDVTIARQGHLTHVECRIHKAPQDVKWIEELIGRRASLKADAMIAVSASGFSQGAIRKAEAHGIILRTLHTLSEQEIRDWGKLAGVEIIYYEFTDTLITFRIPSEASIRGQSITDEHGKLPNYRRMFELVMNTLARDPSVEAADEGKSIQFSAPIISPLFMIEDVKTTRCKIDTTVRRVVRKLSLASVVAYSAPKEVDLTENAYIQHFDAKGFEILQNSDEVGVVVDLTDAATPPRSLLHTVFFDFGRIVTTRWFKMVGLHEAMDYATEVSIRIEWEWANRSEPALLLCAHVASVAHLAGRAGRQTQSARKYVFAHVFSCLLLSGRAGTARAAGPCPPLLPWMAPPPSTGTAVPWMWVPLRPT